MLRKGIGQDIGVLELGEVVTICDHLIPLPTSELKDKIEWKALVIAFHLLVELFRGNRVQISQICVDQDLLAPN